jgi:hypothetical protein
MPKWMGQGCGVVFAGGRLSTHPPLPSERAGSLLLTRERVQRDKKNALHCSAVQWW